MSAEVRRTECRMCGESVPEPELNADWECEVCAELMKLRMTMEKRGLIHPSLFDRTYRPPHNDP